MSELEGRGAAPHGAPEASGGHRTQVGAPGPGQGDNDGVSATGPTTAARLWAQSTAGPAARRIAVVPLTGRTWREVAYCLASVALGFPGFVLTVVLLAAGGLLTVSLVGTVPGLLILVMALRLARWLGSAHCRLGGWLLGEHIPVPPQARPGHGILGRIDAALRDPAGWRGVSYVLLRLPVAAASFYLLVAFWFTGLANLIFPLWWAWPGQGAAGPTPVTTALQYVGIHQTFYVSNWLVAFLVIPIGVVTLLIAPWPTRAIVTADRWLITRLLRQGGLSARVRDLELTRAHAVDDSAATLRRVERDLHDGAQARLVALAMGLGMAREKLGQGASEDDVARARLLVDTAHQGAKEAIAELRDLARGIHPPVLDSGLPEALSALAARSAVPVALTTSIPQRPTPAIEAIAYFCAAELLANAAKHSAAAEVTIDAAEQGGVLRLRVLDDGRGGADPGRGSGLAGLRQRVRTVDGRMSVDSPQGGPTLVTVELPMHA
jgi:signal transduction histidine kinase